MQGNSQVTEQGSAKEREKYTTGNIHRVFFFIIQINYGVTIFALLGN